MTLYVYIYIYTQVLYIHKYSGEVGGGGEGGVGGVRVG